MKVEFVTEEIPIGALWDEYSSKAKPHPHLDDKTSFIVDLTDSPEFVLGHDGLKTVVLLYKNFGSTLKLTLENGVTIEGLPEHKLLDDEDFWVRLDELRAGSFVQDKDRQLVKVLSVSPGEPKDVFDLQVLEGHHYIANGLISHNSTLAAQLGINWASMGEDVTFVPLEMSKKEMTARLLANASSIDVRKILFAKMSKDEKKIFWKAYKKFVISKKKTGGSFRIFKPESDMTIEEILASVYPFGSRVVIIDYISLLKGVDGDDAWQKLGAAARYCKIYAESNNMIIVLLAQVSDEGVIRYARSIAEHANYAWKFVATNATREQEIINIEQLKARNGRMFDFTLKAKMNFMQVRDLDVDEKEELEDKKTTTKGRGGKNNKYKKGKSGVNKGEDDDTPAKSSPSKDYLKDLSDDEDED